MLFIYDKLDLGDVLKLGWIILVDLVPVDEVTVPLELLEDEVLELDDKPLDCGYFYCFGLLEEPLDIFG